MSDNFLRMKSKKQFVRLWFECYQICLEDNEYKDNLKKSKNYYKNWGDVKGVNFDKWFEEKGNIFTDQIVKEIDKQLTYILPEELIGIIWKGKFKGQTQKWFVVKFIGDESEINIKTKNPEFLDWKWIDVNDLTDIAVNFKLNIYRSIKQELLKILN